MATFDLTSKQQEEMVLKNQGLVRHLVNRLHVSQSDFDDMVSVGNIGLIKAVATYDDSRNIKFATYAATCINNEFFMYFRKEKKHANEVYLDSLIANNKDGKELFLLDVIEDENSCFIEEIEDFDVLTDVINIILNCLKPKERLIVLYEMSGYGQNDIANKTNISQSYVSRVSAKAKKKIKQHYVMQTRPKGVFKMSTIGNTYELTFSTEKVKKFNEIFSALLQNLSSAQALPDFKLICNNERIVIKLSSQPETFAFIAQIVQEIDNFQMSYKAVTAGEDSKRTDMESGDKVKEETVSADSNEVTEENEVIISSEVSKEDVELDKCGVTEDLNSDETVKAVSKEDKSDEITVSTESEVITSSEFTKKVIELNNCEVTEDLNSDETVKTVSEEDKSEENAVSMNSSEKNEKNKTIKASKAAKAEKDKNSSSKGHFTQVVEEYIKGKNEFSWNEIKKDLSQIKEGTLGYILHEAKKKGLITAVTKGLYKSKK